MDDVDALQRQVLVQRFQRRCDVCAVLFDHAVRWVARDILEAVEGDPGDYADEPGHNPLVVDEHRWASTWTLDQARNLISGDLGGDALLHWMQERETSLTHLGLGNVVRLAAHGSRLDGPVYSVSATVDLLNRDPAISTGVRRIFDWLLTMHWIVRRGDEYAPAQSALDAQLLAVVPRRKPHDGNPWPQIVLTPTGLAELHLRLGGTDTAVLNPELP